VEQTDACVPMRDEPLLVFFASTSDVSWVPSLCEFLIRKVHSRQPLFFRSTPLLILTLMELTSDGAEKSRYSTSDCVRKKLTDDPVVQISVKFRHAFR
jgi:hypothetical protein